ncbi:MAG: hypothetical protein ABR906_02185 [Terracidiphilus sp.]|jgi:hypothetical protein
MNRANATHEEQKISRAEQIEVEIDRALATEDELIPSSGFLSSVMERVQEEAVAPPPIPFPWMRALPGILFAVGIAAWGAFELVRTGLPAPDLSTSSSFTLTLLHLPDALVAPVEQVGWVALALGASLASWLLARGLAGRGGLL